MRIVQSYALAEKNGSTPAASMRALNGWSMPAGAPAGVVPVSAGDDRRVGRIDERAEVGGLEPVAAVDGELRRAVSRRPRARAGSAPCRRGSRRAPTASGLPASARVTTAVGSAPLATGTERRRRCSGARSAAISVACRRRRRRSRSARSPPAACARAPTTRRGQRERLEPVGRRGAEVEAAGVDVGERAGAVRTRAHHHVVTRQVGHERGRHLGARRADHRVDVVVGRRAT